MKRFIISAAVLFSAAVCIYASSYRITDITYSIAGKTNPKLIQRDIPVDTKTVFHDESALVKYIDDYKQQLFNTRFFEEVIIDYIVSPPDENDACTVSISASLKESFHLLAMPYYKYDSNNGSVFKIKVKDTNFLGTLNALNSDINFQMKQTSETAAMQYIFGASISYNYPFSFFSYDATWTNDDSVTYTIGDSSPEWSLNTGFSFSIPLKRCSLDFSASQGFCRDFDYQKYGDDIYFKDSTSVSLPIVIQHIDNWGDVKYTPSVSASVNWDNDGINPADSDLSSPSFTIGQSISSSRINWKNNFRTGISLSTSQAYTYNFQTETFAPKFSAEFLGFKGFKYAGICTDIYVFSYINSTEKIGGRLRGVRDDQYFASSTGISGTYSCSTPAALVVNVDLPVHLLTTHWTEWPVTRHISFMKYFDFECQVSPFFDFALDTNLATGRIFSYKDGFYCAGLEVIVFPAKWSSIQVRASAGVDVGRYVLAKWLDTSWRDSVSKYEFSFGIGLQY